jgi:transaldolase
VVVKIPAGLEGTETTAALSAEGIKVNYTLCFSVNQAILAARAGAAYVSPFVGRLDDIGEDGMLLIQDIMQVYGQYPEIKTEVIAASIRHPQHCLTAAMAGAHIATIPYAVLLQMARHPLTETGISRFAADWQKVMGDVKNI